MIVSSSDNHGEYDALISSGEPYIYIMFEGWKDSTHDGWDRLCYARDKTNFQCETET